MFSALWQMFTISARAINNSSRLLFHEIFTFVTFCCCLYPDYTFGSLPVSLVLNHTLRHVLLLPAVSTFKIQKYTYEILDQQSCIMLHIFANTVFDYTKQASTCNDFFYCSILCQNVTCSFGKRTTFKYVYINDISRILSSGKASFPFHEKNKIYSRVVQLFYLLI